MSQTDSKQGTQYRTEKAFTLKLCDAIDTPRARLVESLLAADKIDEYLGLTIDPDDYLDPYTFAMDYCVTEVLRKSPNLPIKVDPDHEAFLAYTLSEEQCRNTNERFSNRLSSDWYDPIEGVPFWYGRFVDRVREILGPLTTSRLNRIGEATGGNSSGADIGCAGRGFAPPDKYDMPLSLTESLIPFSKILTGDNWWGWNGDTRVVTDSNRFSTVPKKATISRGICKEARLNVRGQLAIGRELRLSLLAEGIDLDQQAELNRLFASSAHIDDSVTLDLTQASDLWASLVTLDAVGERWGHLLELFRAPKVSFDDGVNEVELEKFSSMGNGFTFELETILFLAVCRTVVPRNEWYRIEVFGDDIIVPRSYADGVIQVLGRLGHSVNTAKSCLGKHFFESCGTDWFDGYPVRPFHLKGASDQIPYALQIANKLRLWSERIAGYPEKRFKPIWDWLIGQLPPAYRDTAVPSFLGDVGVYRTLGEAKALRAVQRANPVDGHGTLEVKIVAPRSRMVRRCSYSVVLYHLDRNGAPSESQLGHVRLPHERELYWLVYDGKLGIPYIRSNGRANHYPLRGVFKGVLRGWTTILWWSDGFDWA